MPVAPAVQMNPFPENWELLEFSEAEPQLADPGGVWFYNRVTFSTIRGEDEVRCAIEPAEYVLDLQWCRGGKELVSLAVRRVRGLMIEKNSGKEVLVVTLDNDHLLPLRVQLKPSVHVFWGTGE